MAPLGQTLSVQQIFTDRLLRVPDYQRGYAWESKHRSEFLQDLESLSPGSEQHYTGTVVLHRASTAEVMDDALRTYTLWDVVDGQQRLTTVVILLHVLQQTFSALGQAQRADGIQRAYVRTVGSDGQPMFRLRLNSDTREFFERAVVADAPSLVPPTIRAHERLRAASTELRAWVEDQRKVRGESFADWLLDTYKKLTLQLQFTAYEVADAADVGVIFEVMNNRGKPLSELEKVKNYLLYLAAKIRHVFPENDLAHTVNTTWSEMFELLSSAGAGDNASEDQLLRVHWVCAYDPDAKAWKGIDSIKKLLPRPTLDRAAVSKTLAAARRYTDSLREAARAYCEARRPAHSQAYRDWAGRDLEVRSAVQKLHRMDLVATFLPLLVAARVRHPTEPEKSAKMAVCCEKYAFRVYRLAKRRSDAGRTTLNQIAHELHAGVATFDGALARAYGALAYYAPDRDCRAALEAVGNWYEHPGLRYLLFEYEEHLAKGLKMNVGWEDNVVRLERSKTIEHVLPQTPTDQYWKQRFDKTARETWTHDLGNLVLTQWNPELSNKPFPEKKGSSTHDRACYARSPWFQERELEHEADWTVAAIESRRKRLVEWAMVRWSTPAGATPAAGAVVESEVDVDEQEG